MPNTKTLTVIAIRDGIAGPQSILKKPHRYRPYPIALDGISIGTLYVKPSESSLPTWLRFFEDTIDPAALPLVPVHKSQFGEQSAGLSPLYLAGPGAPDRHRRVDFARLQRIP